MQTTHQTTECRTRALRWSPSRAPSLCKEERETSLAPHSNSYPAIKTCSRTHQVDMHIRFINNNCFSKCRNSLCIISIPEALRDQDQAMGPITNMETLITVKIKIVKGETPEEVAAVVPQAMSSCLKAKRLSMLLHLGRKQSRPLEVL